MNGENRFWQYKKTSFEGLLNNCNNLKISSFPIKYNILNNIISLPSENRTDS